MKHLLTLALGSCLALAACGSESKTLRPSPEVEELNKQESINAFLLAAEKQQKNQANLLLCEKKGKWGVVDRDDKANRKETLGSCSPITCSRVSNPIAGIDGKEPKDRPSGWLCQVGENSIPQPDIPPNTGGGDNSIPQPGIPKNTGDGDYSIPKPVIPPKQGANPGDGAIAIEIPNPTDPVPAKCAQVTDTRACVSANLEFCSAKTTSGKTLTVSGFTGACQNHLEAALKEKACVAKETLNLSTLVCVASR
jgi:hypothetical protein